MVERDLVIFFEFLNNLKKVVNKLLMQSKKSNWLFMPFSS